ncbi:type 1 fimbrial protein [Gammaproteobacteria bacterium ESL0073]|nr:type 1 fimbrial protein [Gammaproteobacteria bacterium ESL0073]
MKLLALSALLATSLTPVAFAADQANVLHFQGRVTSQTCNVSLNGNPGTTVVVMPTIAEAALATTGTTAGDTPFTLEFTNCSGKVNAKILFAGQYFNFAGRLLNTGTAKNLSIQVTDSLSNSIINFNNPNNTMSSQVDISSGTATIPFVAKYYAESPVTAGTVLASTNYEVVYE